MKITPSEFFKCKGCGKLVIYKPTEEAIWHENPVCEQFLAALPGPLRESGVPEALRIQIGEDWSNVQSN